MPTEHGIDLIGKKILQELATNGRLPFAELGRKVGLSPSAAAERVRQLESLGFIRGYREEIDLAALGYSVTAFAPAKVTAIGSPSSSYLLCIRFRRVTT